jgi:hypothetical protein
MEANSDILDNHFFYFLTVSIPTTHSAPAHFPRAITTPTFHVFGPQKLIWPALFLARDRLATWGSW